MLTPENANTERRVAGADAGVKPGGIQILPKLGTLSIAAY